MNSFVIGKDNTQNGALFLIGHDFYSRMPKKEAEFMIEHDYYPKTKINSDWSNPHIRVEGAPNY